MDMSQSFVLAFICHRIFHSLNVFVDCSVATFERGEHNLRRENSASRSLLLPFFSGISFSYIFQLHFFVHVCMHRWQACHIFVNGFFCIVNRTAEASLEVMTSFIHFDNNNYVYVKDRRANALGPLKLVVVQKELTMAKELYKCVCANGYVHCVFS